MAFGGHYSAHSRSYLQWEGEFLLTGAATVTLLQQSLSLTDVHCLLAPLLGDLGAQSAVFLLFLLDSRCFSIKVGDTGQVGAEEMEDILKRPWLLFLLELGKSFS